MVVAVNTRLLLSSQLEGIGYFTREVFTRLASAHPEHSFHFLLDRPYEGTDPFPRNVHLEVLGPPARHPLLWKYWYDVKVTGALKRLKADVFISPDGFASLTTRVPQCLVVHDLGFLHQPDAYKKSHVQFLRFFTPRFARKAASIATVSEFSKNDLVAQYGIDPARIQVVYSAVKPVFQPLDGDEKAAVKEQYTGGREYFIYAGAIQPRKNLVNLLKAFSKFKKRQKNSWKLVLAGRLAWKNGDFLDLLKSYKFRDDVVLTGYVSENELARLVGASYALVYPSLFEGFGVPPLEAIQCAVPPLTSEASAMEEIAGEAALYFNPTDPHSIANALMRIYQDEDSRAALIAKGHAIAAQYSWDRTASLLWDSVLRAVAAQPLPSRQNQKT
ncbi:MAG: glycosyltransferase family 4 protein [Flaviaesturariibacter sp.]|nr:glycosyltransferase family 4 protein [Flaviaesturariibacter sp.]